MTHTDQQRGSSHKIYYHKKGPDHNVSRIVTQVTIINQQGGGVYHQTFQRIHNEISSKPVAI